MDCYREMYYKLFNKVTDIISELQKVQQETEDILLSCGKEESDNVLHITVKGEGEDGTDKKPPRR